MASSILSSLRKSLILIVVLQAFINQFYPETVSNNLGNGQLLLHRESLGYLEMGHELATSWLRNYPPKFKVKTTAEVSSFTKRKQAIRLFQYISTAILLQRCGDVAVLLNPGPCSRFNSVDANFCPSCRSSVTRDDPFKFCSGCDQFYHHRCVGNNAEINQITDTWICNNCAAPTINTSYSSGNDSLNSLCHSDDEIEDSVSNTRSESSASNSFYNLQLPSTGLRFGHWNVDYLTNSKFDQIKLILMNAENPPDVLFLTETFLKPVDCIEKYEIPGYTPLRKDRLNKEGGGILVYYRNELNLKRRDDLEHDLIEIMWLEVCPFKSNRSLLLAGLYRPKSYSKEQDEMFIQCIENAYLTNKEIILTGDINIDFLTPAEFKKDRLSKSLKSMLFNQLVNMVTRPISGTCLDHIYSNSSHHITSIHAPNYGLSDHLPVFAVRKYFRQPKQTRGHNTMTYRNLKNIDENAFKATLRNSPWDTAFIFDDIDDCLSAWESIFGQAVDSHAPLKQKRITNKTQPDWMTSQILDQLKHRDHLLKRARKTRSGDDWTKYRRARNLVTSSIEKAKRTFFKSSIKNSRDDPKSMWKHIKSLTGRKAAQQPTSLQDQNYGIILDTPTGIAEYFYLHFISVARKIKTALKSNCQRKPCKPRKKGVGQMLSYLQH